MKRLSFNKILSYILLSCTIFISVSFCYLRPVKADIWDVGGIRDTIQTILDIINENEDVPEQILEDLFWKCTGIKGFIPEPLFGFSVHSTKKCISNFINYLYPNNPPKTPETITQEDTNEYARYITRNIDITFDPEITFNDSFKNEMVSYANNIIDEAGFSYVYSFRLLDSLSNFQNQAVYDGIRRFLVNNNYDVVFLASDNGSTPYLYAFNFDNLSFVKYADNQSHADSVYCHLYDFNTKNVYYLDSTIADRFIFDNSDFVKDTNSWTKENININVQLSYVEANIINNYTGNWVLSMNDYITYKMYKTYNDFLEDTSLYDSYYNSVLWDNFVNSNNTTYTIDSSNSNNITYGDVTSYINEYHDSNGTYPDINDIQVFIDNNIPNSDPTPTPTPTPDPDDPNGGGGSGGSGGSGDSDNIFDFLSKIGEVLGSLIKNLGNVLADLVAGIGSIISSLIESIPTVFSDFLGALIGWLPSELQALISLSITAMIIIGLIKLFKG